MYLAIMLENNKQTKGVYMRQYPIWVDMVNNSYNSSKSYGVNDYNIQNVMIGTSRVNSFDFVKIEMSVRDNDNIKTYELRVDDKLVKKAKWINTIN